MNRFGLALGAGLLSVALIAGCADGNGDDDLGLDSGLGGEADSGLDLGDLGDNGTGTDGDTAPTATVMPTEADEDGAATATAAAGETVETSIEGGTLEDLDVSPGDTVVWTNEDAEARTITSTEADGAPVDSGAIAPGDTYEHTFTEAGVWDLVVDGGDEVWVIVAE